MAAGMLSTVTSCQDDWTAMAEKSDVHYSAANTIWENIVLDPNLSEFAKLVQKTGFNEKLNSENYYTVWAPLNGTFNFDELMEKDSIFVRQTFVENLVTTYSHGLTGNFTERIVMLNKKQYDFDSESRTMGDVKIEHPNIASCNGLLHTMNGNSLFRYNMYEAFDELVGCKSFVDYFKKYDESILDTKKSILGPMVDGKQTYLDSVMIYRNSFITSTMNANLTEEDSTYTIIVPNDEAWAKIKEKTSADHVYLPSLVYQDLSKSTSSNVTASTGDVKVTVTNTQQYLDYLKDSLSTREFADYLFYNNNVHYNKFLVDESSKEKDTLYTTRSTNNRPVKLSNAQEILANQVGEPMKQSNGYMRIVSDLPLRSWETYCPVINVNPYNNQARTLVCSPTRGTLYRDQLDPSIGVLDSLHSYINYYAYEGSSVISNPEIDFYIPNVRAHAYNIYMIVAPSCVDAESADAKRRSNILTIDINYSDAKGNLVDKNLLTKYVTDKDRIDTIQLAKNFEFPVAYYGEARPNIKVKTGTSFLLSDATKNEYEQTIRIIAIVLRPVEYDEVEPFIKED